jgi:hypothetical protein
MNSTPALFATLMQMPEKERFEIAIAVLDETSPGAMSSDEIIRESSARQDELENGSVQALDYSELVAGIRYRPRSFAS